MGFQGSHISIDSQQFRFSLCSRKGISLESLRDSMHPGNGTQTGKWHSNRVVEQLCTCCKAALQQVHSCWGALCSSLVVAQCSAVWVLPCVQQSGCCPVCSSLVQDQCFFNLGGRGSKSVQIWWTTGSAALPQHPLLGEAPPSQAGHNSAPAAKLLCSRCTVAPFPV